jgi:hypothetical protein
LPTKANKALILKGITPFDPPGCCILLHTPLHISLSIFAWRDFRVLAYPLGMIHRRNNTFHLRRRVPKRYQDVESRKIVEVSLHTDSERVAAHKAEGAWAQLTEAWEARLAGDSEDAERRFAAAQELAAVRGHRYMSAPKVAQLPVEELLSRVEAVMGRDGKPDKTEAAALLGGAKEPAITVTRALDLYWSLAADKTRGKSEDQLRR